MPATTPFLLGDAADEPLDCLGESPGPCPHARHDARLRPDQMGHGDALCREFPHRQHPAVHRRGGEGDRRQAGDPAAQQRLPAADGPDQARRADRPGAARRDPAERLFERGSLLRGGRRPLPCLDLAAGRGAERRDRALCPRPPGTPGADPAVYGALGRAGLLRQDRDPQRRRAEGHPLPRLQQRHRADGGADGRDAGDGAGGRGQPGLRHQCHPVDVHLGADRRERHGLGLHPLLDQCRRHAHAQRGLRQYVGAAGARCALARGAVRRRGGGHGTGQGVGEAGGGRAIRPAAREGDAAAGAVGADHGGAQDDRRDADRGMGAAGRAGRRPDAGEIPGGDA